MKKPARQVVQAAAPRISVVIPHLNEPDNLQRCLEAIYQAGKHGPTFEVIVADNGSVTPPDAVCARFPGVRIVVEAQPGPGPARNAGAALARGDLICFIDADCFVAPDYLTVCLDYFDSHPKCDFVGGSIGIVPSLPPGLTPSEAYEAAFSYRTEMFVSKQGFAATGNMVVRRSVFRAVGPFAGIARHEDRVWGNKSVALEYNIAYLPAARVLTVGCRDVAQLLKRVERHVVHDWTEQGSSFSARLKWICTAGLVLLSSPLAIREIMRCPQIDSFMLGFQVFTYLCRIRSYRSWLMLTLLLSDSADHRLSGWNRT